MTTTRPTDLPATPPPAAPRAPRSTAGRVLTGAGIAVGVVLLALSVAQVLATLAEETTSARTEHAATRAVELVADGEVRVSVAEAGVRGGLRVERVARFAWTVPRYEVTASADRTVVRHECPRSWPARCSADLAVTLPQGTDLVVRTADGRVRVTGPAGDVVVRAADGDVEVTGAQGGLVVDGSDGDVTARDVRGDVTVRLADGEAQVSGAGGDVVLRSGDGAVLLSGVAGDVDLRASDGRVEVRDVGGALTARTRDGDVLVAQVRGDVTVLGADGDVTVHGTGEPVALRVTSTGRQRVEGATDPDADVTVELRASAGDVAYLGPEG